MEKYTLDFESQPNQESNSPYINIRIVEKIKTNESFGDQIGLYKENNSLEFDELIDIDEKEIRDFIYDNFNQPKAVCGFIRRLIE